METQKESFDELCDLLENYIGGPRDKFSTATTLNYDLGLDGDDAHEFIVAYANKFSVDISKFEFEKYFNVEGFSVVHGLLRYLFSKNKLQPIAIDRFLAGIIRGKLE